MQGHDRRKYPRLEGHFTVDLLNMGDDNKVSNEVVVQAEALDISMKGMRIKANYNAPVGGLLSAVVYFKGHESICLSEVVWKRETKGSFVYGLFFKAWSKLDPSLEKALQAMEVQEENKNTTPSGPTPADSAITSLAA